MYYLYPMAIFRMDQWECFDWCTKNKIKVYPVPRKWNDKEQEIEVNINGKITRSGKKYKLADVDEKVWELYCHLHDTRNNKV